MAKLTVFMTIALGFVSHAGAELLQVSSQKIALREFEIDVTDKAIGAVVRCAGQQITQGVWNQVSTREDDRSFRRLTASYQPLEGNAAWYVSNDVCPSLGALTNGIGFQYYNPKGGEAMIYLAHFEPRAARIDTVQMGGSQDRQFQNPKFNMTNDVLLPAKCEVVLRHGWMAASAFVCQFADRKGQVVFEVKNDRS